MKILGQRIREARQRLELTQKQLGELARLSDMAVCHFECGRRLPSAKNLAALAVALRVSADWLLGLESARKLVQWPKAQRRPWRVEDC